MKGTILFSPVIGFGAFEGVTKVGVVVACGKTGFAVVMADGLTSFKVGVVVACGKTGVGFAVGAGVLLFTKANSLFNCSLIILIMSAGVAVFNPIRLSNLPILETNSGDLFCRLFNSSSAFPNVVVLTAPSFISSLIALIA